MKQPVLIVIDIQKEYTTSGRPFYLEMAGPSLSNAKRVLEFARKSDWPIIHVKHLQLGSIFNPESPLSDFVDGFEPLAHEMSVIKGNYSSFSSPEFVELMDQFKDRESMVIGYGSTMCCLSTIIDGYHRGFKMAFVLDASCAKRGPTFDEQSTHAHAEEIISIYAKIASTQELIATGVI